MCWSFFLCTVDLAVKLLATLLSSLCKGELSRWSDVRWIDKIQWKTWLVYRLSVKIHKVIFWPMFKEMFAYIQCEFPLKYSNILAVVHEVFIWLRRTRWHWVWVLRNAERSRTMQQAQMLFPSWISEEKASFLFWIEEYLIKRNCDVIMTKKLAISLFLGSLKQIILWHRNELC